MQRWNFRSSLQDVHHDVDAEDEVGDDGDDGDGGGEASLPWFEMIFMTTQSQLQ